MSVKITSATNAVFKPEMKPGISKGAAGSFGEHLKNYMADVNELQQAADQKIEELASGQNANIHETLIAVEKANISFRMMMQLRNKIVSAYEEIMRMQV
ncbi:MAG: flagellar hook-basal body complex protein FliE [Pseudomonadota bacterium]